MQILLKEGSTLWGIIHFFKKYQLVMLFIINIIIFSIFYF